MTASESVPRYVVLGDVIASREIQDRMAFRERLTGALETVDERYEESLFAPFEPIKGVDEFGGVLAELAAVADVLETILDRIHPVQVRFGIAAGGIDVGEAGDPVTDMDGPAFHRADGCLDETESEDLYVGVQTDRSIDGLLEGALNLLLLGREGYTDRQVEVIRAYERHGTQSAAATALDVPQQSISQTLARANYQQRTVVRRTLRESLAAIDEEARGGDP